MSKRTVYLAWGKKWKKKEEDVHFNLIIKEGYNFYYIIIYMIFLYIVIVNELLIRGLE